MKTGRKMLAILAALFAMGRLGWTAPASGTDEQQKETAESISRYLALGAAEG
jgi:hypothetical protein